MNGIGGLEGIIHGKTGDSMGVINDITGNIAAYAYHGETHFLEGNVDNYGRLSGDEWLTEDAEDIMSNAVFWVLKNSRFRGRRVEGNGLSNFGARYYNTETGSFLSADPYGHDGSLDLYSYASADPVNYVDPDGRLSQPVNEGSGSSWKDFATQTLKTAGSFLADSTPFIGTAKAVNELHTGRDPITGESIGRVWAAAGVVGSVIPGGKPVIKGARKVVQTGARALEKGLSAAKNLVKAKPATKTFKNMEVRAVRNLSHIDSGTLEAMSKHGFAPKTIRGDRTILHHHQQNPAGFIIEMPSMNHKIGNPRQHPFSNKAGAGLTKEQREGFNQWRVDYWKFRAREELAKRGAK